MHIIFFYFLKLDSFEIPSQVILYLDLLASSFEEVREWFARLEYFHNSPSLDSPHITFDKAIDFF